MQPTTLPDAPTDAMLEAFAKVYPNIPWAARFSSKTWAHYSRIFEATWAAATAAEQERCCGIVFGQCSSDNVAQRTADAIRGTRHGRQTGKKEAVPASWPRFWVIELRPAIPGQLPYPPIYSAECPSTPGQLDISVTGDILQATPRWPLQADAEAAAKLLSGTRGTRGRAWRAVEYGFGPEPDQNVRVIASDIELDASFHPLFAAHRSQT